MSDEIEEHICTLTTETPK